MEREFVINKSFANVDSFMIMIIKKKSIQIASFYAKPTQGA